MAVVLFLIELLLLWQAYQQIKDTQKLDTWLRNTVRVCGVLKDPTTNAVTDVVCVKVGATLPDGEQIPAPPKCSWGKCQ